MNTTVISGVVWCCWWWWELSCGDLALEWKILPHKGNKGTAFSREIAIISRSQLSSSNSNHKTILSIVGLPRRKCTAAEEAVQKLRAFFRRLKSKSMISSAGCKMVEEWRRRTEKTLFDIYRRCLPNSFAFFIWGFRILPICLPFGRTIIVIKQTTARKTSFLFFFCLDGRLTSLSLRSLWAYWWRILLSFLMVKWVTSKATHHNEARSIYFCCVRFRGFRTSIPFCDFRFFLLARNSSKSFQLPSVPKHSNELTVLLSFRSKRHICA